MSDLATAYAVIQGAADAIGKLAGLKEQLKAKPDRAAAALAGALAEVHRTYLAVDLEITRVIVLAAPGALGQNSDPEYLIPLFELEGGKVLTRVEQSQGHCTRIKNIYERDLNNWFERVFGRGEANHLIVREVFETLGHVDKQAYDLMRGLAESLGMRAGAILAEMKKAPPDHIAAQALARAAYSELKPIRAALQQLDRQISGLEDEFIEMSGAA